jgi:hypothetical protein
MRGDKREPGGEQPVGPPFTASRDLSVIVGKVGYGVP